MNFPKTMLAYWFISVSFIMSVYSVVTADIKYQLLCMSSCFISTDIKMDIDMNIYDNYAGIFVSTR